MESENPLLNDLVLDHVLDFVIKVPRNTSYNQIPANLADISEEMKRYRLVCKTWMWCATRAFRAIRPITRFENSKEEKLIKFLKIMKPTSVIPIQRFEIDAEIFAGKDNKIFEDFVRICLPVTEVLRIFNYIWNPIDVSSAEFNDLDFPKMKVFEIKGKVPKAGNNILTIEGPKMSTLPQLVMGAARNLLEFKLDLTSTDQGKVRKISEIVLQLLPRCVTSLKLIIPETSQEQFQILGDKKPKLKKYQLACDSFVGDIMFVFDFVGMQTGSLENLAVGGKCGIILEALAYLRTVQCALPKSRGAQKLAVDLLPKLEVFDIKHIKRSSTFRELVLCDNISFSVQEFHLPCHYLQVPCIKLAKKCFPYIKRLTISESLYVEETLRYVCEHMSELEELSISLANMRSKYGDSLLCGIHFMDCQRFAKQAEDYFRGITLDGIPRTFNLLHLTKLKKLVLKDCSNVDITDFTAHFAFLHMPYLEELHFEQSRVSNQYVKALEIGLDVTIIGNARN